MTAVEAGGGDGQVDGVRGLRSVLACGCKKERSFRVLACVHAIGQGQEKKQAEPNVFERLATVSQSIRAHPAAASEA